MNNSFESFVALRYLRSKRKEVFISIITIISIIGVALSVMVLNVVLSVMTGFETTLQRKLVDANAHITVRRFGGEMSGYQEVLEKARNVKGVVAAYPYTYSQGMISTAFGARGLILRGVADDPAARGKLSKLAISEDDISRLFTPVEKEILRPDGELDTVKYPPLIVGAELARDMNLRPATAVTLFSPQLNVSPQGVAPTLRRFVVVAKYESGLTEYEGGLAYIALRDAQAFFDLGEAVTGVELEVEDLFRAPEIAQQVAAALNSENEALDVRDWTEQNQPLWEAIRLEKRVYFIVLLLLILIASFSIVSTLVMVVMEKGKDIAILKSMGASSASIARIFFYQGAIIGLLGIIFGTGLGVLGCVGLKMYGFEIDQRIFSMKEVPVQMEFWNFILVAFAAFAITLLSGIYPARRAAGLRPADALRYE